MRIPAVSINAPASSASGATAVSLGILALARTISLSIPAVSFCVRNPPSRNDSRSAQNISTLDEGESKHPSDNNPRSGFLGGVWRHSVWCFEDDLAVFLN